MGIEVGRRKLQKTQSDPMREVRPASREQDPSRAIKAVIDFLPENNIVTHRRPFSGSHSRFEVLDRFRTATPGRPPRQGRGLVALWSLTDKPG
jgi:hypothetical protein